MGTQLVMYDEEYNRINAVCDRLTKDANAKVVFIVDKNGQLISASGQTQNIDTTSLASLTAGNVAAIAVLGIIGTGFAYVLNYQIITSEGATIASTVTYLLPVVAIVLVAAGTWLATRLARGDAGPVKV